MHTLLVGDVREMLRSLPDESVHCVVTSPPYWGLRNYGVEGQIGLETSFEEHLGVMVEVFREVRRVLRHDGTCWVNYGDCYASGSRQSGPPREDRGFSGSLTSWASREQYSQVPTAVGGLKPKDLVMMPSRVALALQADGWWIRSEIVWAKPNPMPESCRDRPTSAHEKVFLLTKSPRYFYDADAVREPLVSTPEEYLRAGKSVRENHAYGEVGGRPLRGKSFASVPNGRNLRNVWHIPTQAFPEAHFATFPEKLIEPCIKAGTSEKGCCPSCGSPWTRITERSPEDIALRASQAGQHRAGNDPSRVEEGSASRGATAKVGNYTPTVYTVGWKPGCACSETDPVPCKVLDPFTGSGTTGVVALRLGREFLGIELNQQYAALANERITASQFGLTIKQFRAPESMEGAAS